jgi:hypothetical protein
MLAKLERLWQPEPAVKFVGVSVPDQTDPEAIKRRELPGITVTFELEPHEREEIDRQVRACWRVVRKRGAWLVAHFSPWNGRVSVVSVDGKPYAWPSEAEATAWIDEQFAGPLTPLTLPPSLFGPET